ncbi:MAG: hypothetical protein PUC98_00430 [Clostridiales bacterium]|nr:hypothetical protein [Clostridiales bacterium]
MNKPKHTYKDNTFCTLFNDKERIIELYNALTGSNYDKDTPVEIVTLENTFFGDRINDLSFIIDHRWIILTEQQSTLCPNLPLRSLVYIAREYEKLAFSRDIYSKKLVKIPTPEFYVFYNGAEDAPVEQEMRLSDAFMTKAGECGTISLEVVVKFINVNYEKGAELLTKCKTMQGYSVLIYKIREKQKAHGNLAAAIEESIRECESEGILADYLKEHGGDVMSFLFEKMSREECEAVREADGYDRGFECGKREGEAAGFKQGETAGAENKAREIAINLKKAGFDIDVIAANTGLTKEEIEKL